MELHVLSFMINDFYLQLLSVLDGTLQKLAHYDQSSMFSSILTLTVRSNMHLTFALLLASDRPSCALTLNVLLFIHNRSPLMS